MEPSHDQSHYIQQTQVQKIAPHLIQASEILQCTAVELQQSIERELMENPALEAIELSNDRCSECEFRFGVCNSCPFADRKTIDSDAQRVRDAAEESGEIKSSNESEDTNYKDDSEPDQDPDYDIGPLLALSELTDPHVKEDFIEDSFDPISLAPSLPNLRDHLMSRLRTLTSGERSHRINEYLVNSLDDRGWLKIDRVEVMVSLGIDEETLDEHIKALQNCDPVGIGARNLQECLLIQLVHYEEDSAGHPLAKLLVENHWELLTQRRFDLLARKTSRSQSEIADAVRFIQNELSPAPASQYREPWDHKPDLSAEAIKPDVIIRRSSTGFDIEVTGLDLPTLHINARYRRMYEDMREEKRQRTQVAPPKGRGLDQQRPEPYSSTTRTKVVDPANIHEKRHIAQYVERANLFLKNIQQRKKTIERITRCLIEAQQGFIETGSRAFLIPMTRTDLAHKANLHESTVSRALLRKFVQLPSQDVISFDAFFAPAGSVKDLIAAIISNEDESSPYSDEALRLKLEASGISIARRTIVKYRESLRIPASYLRRKH